MSKPPPGAPWTPYNWADNLPAVYALQALQKGEANPEQQKQALDLIITQLSAYYELSYNPTNPRDTDFAEGKRFVGAQVVKLLKLSPAVIEASKRKPKPSR